MSVSVYLSLCLSPPQTSCSDVFLHCVLKASQRALVAVENQSAKTLEAQKIKRNLQAVRKVSEVKRSDAKWSKASSLVNKRVRS